MTTVEKFCFNFSRVLGSVVDCVKRDLKHQDGRWRRGRHIRVKADARPASRFTRLSMLSNIATATSGEFLEKISLRKYLENKSSFAIARGEPLVAYDEETVDYEEFVLLLKKNISGNPSFPYKHYEEFDFETTDPVQCKAEFSSREKCSSFCC